MKYWENQTGFNPVCSEMNSGPGKSEFSSKVPPGTCKELRVRLSASVSQDPDIYYLEDIPSATTSFCKVDSTERQLKQLFPIFLPKTGKTLITWLSFLLFLGIFIPNSSAQTTITLEPTADARITSLAATTNYGSCNETWVSAASRTLMRYNVSSIPAGATILSATLTLYQNTTSSTTDNIEVRRLTNDWTENSGSCTGNGSTTANWNQRMSGTNWTTAGGDMAAAVYANTYVGTTVGNFSWNVTSLVQE